jgi:hypothetical protein
VLKSALEVEMRYADLRFVGEAGGAGESGPDCLFSMVDGARISIALGLLGVFSEAEGRDSERIVDDGVFSVTAGTEIALLLLRDEGTRFPEASRR